MILDLDCGNSTLAWRKGAATGRLAADDYAGLRLEGVRRVRVCSVRDRAWNRALAEHLGDAGLAAEFAVVEAERGGLRIAYSDPARLGVDRWLALQSGWHEAQGAFAVADMGTAITLDIVDDAGLHLGGWIAPGLCALPHALPSGLPRPVAGAQRRTWGDSTESAIRLGCAAMAAGMVRQFCHQRAGDAPLYVCGGDAASLMHLMDDLQPIPRPQMVLDGLALVLGPSASGGR